MTHGLDTSFLVALECEEHELHPGATRLLEQLIGCGDRVAVVPQVLTEFVHVVTDPRRFQQPLSTSAALARSEFWWTAGDVEQVLPSDAAVVQFHAWMSRHQLGRKRVLDTMLAATLHKSGIGSLLTANPADFAVFAELACVPFSPSAAQS